eukprot:PhF_6_TR30148/c0_g1_i1/m.44134/K11381/bkdA; 2-oxoisovalerate dehydrogenase E1 component
MTSLFSAARAAKMKELNALPEFIQSARFVQQLSEMMPTESLRIDATLKSIPWDVVLRSAFSTTITHTEARAAAYIGKGYYTIGPCGEELSSLLGVHLKAYDPIALHYRHLACGMARTLVNAKPEDYEAMTKDVLLSRARASCVSIHDPVTGGVHCALGSRNPQADFVVTSTLASQCPPALGRALGGVLCRILSPNTATFPNDFISLVSVGDGSTHNAHFLSAINLTRYAVHRGYKCPILYVVSDNELSISLKGYGYVKSTLKGIMQNFQYFEADGSDALSMWTNGKSAVDAVRKSRNPGLLYVHNIPRRFGHAATDRQSAYLTKSEIESNAARNPLLPMCQLLVDNHVYTGPQLRELYQSIWDDTILAFDKADQEPKIDRKECLARVVRPAISNIGKTHTGVVPSAQNTRTMVMRKQMTKIYEEMLQTYKNCVYIGEDVEHGGYYLVTEGMAAKFPHRVRDFPPDETTLLGAGMGFRHAGLIPIVEIPYAKYLDCASDMFYEAAIMPWLTQGKQTNGMLLRLQGFDRGLFGGNFHTHNILHKAPGMDVVCYSNGRDYTRGIRYAMEKLIIPEGRMVMSVDCTALLNVRDWEQEYPSVTGNAEDDYLPFDDVVVYPSSTSASSLPRVAIITYGNGVLTSLDVAKSQQGSEWAIDVIDCPLLSDVPTGLAKALESGRYEYVLFADICKEGNAPLVGLHMAKLQRGDLKVSLPALKKVSWVAGCYTYNPLGSVCTFLNKEDIAGALQGFR